MKNNPIILLDEYEKNTNKNYQDFNFRIDKEQLERLKNMNTYSYKESIPEFTEDRFLEEEPDKEPESEEIIECPGDIEVDEPEKNDDGDYRECGKEEEWEEPEIEIEE